MQLDSGGTEVETREETEGVRESKAPKNHKIFSIKIAFYLPIKTK